MAIPSVVMGLDASCKRNGRSGLMVVPSGLADSLNAPGIMGLAGAAGIAPESAGRVQEPGSEDEDDESEP